MWSSETLAALTGAILSFAVEYIPGVNTWFDTLDTVKKRLVMVALLALTSVLVYGVSCTGWLESIFPGTGVTCDEAGLAVVVNSFFRALAANQATFVLAFQNRNKTEIEEIPG